MTVGEFITRLNQFHPDLPLRIIDANISSHYDENMYSEPFIVVHVDGEDGYYDEHVELSIHNDW